MPSFPNVIHSGCAAYCDLCSHDVPVVASEQNLEARQKRILPRGDKDPANTARRDSSTCRER
jgi:hypothetical protein